MIYTTEAQRKRHVDSNDPSTWVSPTERKAIKAKINQAEQELDRDTALWLAVFLIIMIVGLFV